MQSIDLDQHDRARRSLRYGRVSTAMVLALCGMACSILAAEPGASEPTTEPLPVIPVSVGEGEKLDVPAQTRPGFLVAPYIWVPSIKGPVGAGSTRQSIDVSSSDLLKDGSGGMGYLRWTFGRQFVYFEGVGASFKDDRLDSFFGQSVDADIVFLEAGYGLDFRLESSMLPQGHVWLSPYAGVRYASLDVSNGLNDPIRTFAENPAAALLALQQQVPMKVSEEAIDLALGFFTDVPLSERFSFLLKLDGAGFNLDRTNYWNAAGTFGYDFTKRFSILAGYRIANIKAEADKDNRLNIDWRLKGPIGSLTYTF